MKRLLFLFFGILFIGFSWCSKGFTDTQTPPLWEPNAVNIVAYQALLNYISQNFTGLTINFPYSGIPDPGCPGGFSGFSYGIYPFNVQITIPGQYNSQPNLNLSWNGATQSILLAVNDIHAHINQVDGVIHAVALWICTTCGFSVYNLNADASANLNVKPYIDGHYLRLTLVGTPSVNIQPIPEPSPPTVCGITIPQWAWDAIWSLIQGAITSAVNSAINSALVPQINQMLNSININLYLYGTYPPVSYQIRPSLFYEALNITSNAADISLDAGVGPSGEPAPCLPLPIALPPTPTIYAPTINTARTDVMLGFGVSQDLINQALYAVYLSGMMCITTPPLPVGLLKGLIPELPSTGTLILKIIPTQPPTLTLGTPQDMWDTVNLNGIIIEGLLGVDEAQTYPDASASYNTQYAQAFVLSANVSIRAEVYLDQNKLDQNGNPMIVVAIDSTPGSMKISDVILASELTKPSNIDSMIKMGLSLATSFIGTALPTISSAFTFSGVTALVKDIEPSGGYLNIYLDVTGFMNLFNLSNLSKPQVGFLSYNNPSTGILNTMSLNGNLKPLVNTRSGVIFKLNSPLPNDTEISWRISDQSVFGPVWQGWSLWSTDTTIQLDNLMDGEHALQIRLRDAQTGFTVTGDTTIFTVDTIPPTLTLSKANYPYFTFNISDAVTKSRLMYAIDDQTSFTMLPLDNNTINVGNSTVGKHTLYVKAIDEAGNYSSVVAVNYTVTASFAGGCGTAPFNTSNVSLFDFVFSVSIALLFIYICLRKEKTES